MGPLSGIKVVQLVGIGPGPFCGMLLADLGADVVRVERPGGLGQTPSITARGQCSVTADLKNPVDLEKVLALVAVADVLIDPYRPGVAERLGVGPEECLQVNPRLVYGRMTGWGQSGPQADRAGHDINYIALSGTLSLCGMAGGPPVPPVNLLGDFAGGAMFLAVGILAAVVHARDAGRGQVVDAAMVDGAAYLTAMVQNMMAKGTWGPRGTNVLDTGAPFYNVYRTADGAYVSIGAIEPQFYAQLLDILGLAHDDRFADQQNNRELWPWRKAQLAEIFATRTRNEWIAAFQGRDACFAPVWTLDEASEDPHMQERRTFVTEYGVRQPAPAPRFSVTPGAIGGPPSVVTQDFDEVLASWGALGDDSAKASLDSGPTETRDHR